MNIYEKIDLSITKVYMKNEDKSRILDSTGLLPCCRVYASRLMSLTSDRDLASLNVIYCNKCSGKIEVEKQFTVRKAKG